jgi:glycerol-3-phosphate dehydrogenase (NAD(P)+)
MNQTAEGLAAIAPVLELAKAKGVVMPIVTQVGQVLDGSRDPRELAPHFATDSDLPEGE